MRPSVFSNGPFEPDCEIRVAMLINRQACDNSFERALKPLCEVASPQPYGSATYYSFAEWRFADVVLHFHSSIVVNNKKTTGQETSCFFVEVILANYDKRKTSDLLSVV
jgi:hypothetical protein